jgi:integrase
VCDARTKGQAIELLREIQVAEDRARNGLDKRPPRDGGGTVDAMVEWWVEKFLSKRASYSQCIGTIRRHIIGSPLGARRLVDVTAGQVEAFLEEKSADLPTETLNHLRGYLGRAFNLALRTRRFVGANPVTSVPKRKVPKRLPDYLRPTEVPPLLAAVRPKWRALFATAIYTGLRKGELFALRKSDVDLASGLITVARSHARNTPKNSRAEAVPINTELLTHYLEQAIRISPSDLVFPGPDGKMFPKNTQLELTLRRAMRRADLVTGYIHKCRRKGCGHQEPTADANPPLPEVQLQALPDRPGAEHPLPPPAPHDGLAAAHERRRPRRGPADHAPPGPAHDDRVLRPPRGALPQARSGAPFLRGAPRRGGRSVAATAAPGTAVGLLGGRCPGVAAARRTCAPWRAKSGSIYYPVTTHPFGGHFAPLSARNRWKGSTRSYGGRGERIRTSDILLPNAPPGPRTRSLGVARRRNRAISLHVR